VKPSNILLEDTVERAVLTDFGLARAMDDASLTQTGILAGTPHYMSPEQAMGAEIDSRSDLFSLGAVLYFMAAGHPPFRAGGALAVLHRICQEKHRPVWQWNKQVPDELSEIVNRLLEKKPSRRFASADEVRQQLAQLLSRVQQHGVGRLRTARWRGRGRHLAVAAAVLIAVTLTIVAGSIRYWGGVPTTANPVVASAGIDGADAMQEVVGVENEYRLNLDVVRKALFERPQEKIYLHGDDTWRRSLDEVERDLSNLESDNR
jgi:eukaryotic-like serine/threonine-protein kinase